MALQGFKFPRVRLVLFRICRRGFLEYTRQILAYPATCKKERLTMTQPASSLVYVGTYTSRGAEGIYAYRYDTTTGTLSALGVTTGIANPTFLALHPDGTHLYAVNEVAELEGRPGGALSAYQVDASTGALTALNRQSTVGSGPCHVAVDHSGRYALVANYGSGSVAMLPIQEDGSLKEASDFHQHAGSGPHPRRQQGPHAHSVTISADNRYAFVADLGMDKIVVYKLDLERGKLIPNDEPWALTYAGAGPRHFAFHPNSAYAYMINELGSSVTVFAYDAVLGTLHELQTLSSLPEGFEGHNTCADIHLSQSGEFLYGSNRGHDSIAIFAVDPGAGTLTAIGHQSTLGKTPRNFGLSPDGRFLLAANQDSNDIFCFRVDAESGQLSPTGHKTEVPAPVCIKWL
jgi:6-phosphogluconolactonase